MKLMKSGILVLCIFSFSFLKAQQQIVNNTVDLLTIANGGETVIVKDTRSGGLFVHIDTGVSPDNGVVFPRANGGFWVRQFDRATGVNPFWWGAKGDGFNNDLTAIKAATAYCLANQTILQFPSGVFRINAPWIIGGKSVEEEDLFLGNITKAKSFKPEQHQVARESTPLIVRGSVRTCIYGDFAASKLTAIIYYNIKSNGYKMHPSPHLYTHEFSNIGIYAQGYFRGMNPTPPETVNLQNQQIGLVIVYCTNSKIDGCGFYGLKYGLFYKTAYFCSLKNAYFELCQTGLFTTDYNANMLENIVGFYCKLVAEINGAQIVVNNFNSEFCESTLKFKGKNIVLNGVYCENTDLKIPSNYHLIFGRNEKDPGYNARSITTGVVLNGVTLTANGRDVILLEDDMKEMTITGANMNGNIITKRPGNKIIFNSAIGNYKVIGPGKQRKVEVE